MRQLACTEYDRVARVFRVMRDGAEVARVECVGKGDAQWRSVIPGEPTALHQTPTDAMDWACRRLAELATP